MTPKNCTNCGLSNTRIKVVQGEGPQYAKIMFVAEGPGEFEDAHGTPFYYLANAGQEFDRYLQTINLDRANIYVTNTVKCRPPNNRDPHPDEISACRGWLLMEIAEVQPRIIVTVGAVSTRNFLGNVELEVVHGIPFEVTIKETGQKVIVVPCYHPAAGLRSPDFAQLCAMDFANVGAVLRGKLGPAHFRDPMAGSESYGILETPNQVIDAFGSDKLIAVDTETLDWKYTPYMVSASTAPGTGYVMFADSAKVLAVFAEILAQPSVTTLIHNCLFDIFVLEKLKIFPALIHDTMIMAYLLQSEPQGLKALAFRYWGMAMKDYEDMVSQASSDLAEEYLHAILNYTWPPPDKILEIKPNGKFHYKQPQNIAKVVARIFSDREKGKIQRADYYTRWHKLKEEETGRSVVEAALGEMPMGNLSMVPQAEAVWYACRDADATIRVHPYLWSRIVDSEMVDVFNLDMGIIPMVKDMMDTGIQPIPEELRRLGEHFAMKMRQLEFQVQKNTGHTINLGSPLQVADLLFNKLRIRVTQKHKGKISTDDKTLARIVASHPAVPMIREWRGYSKLKSTYTSKLHKFIAEDNRIHTKISVTRTATGRLASSKPNLMNQPTRSEDGKAIRKAFTAREGCVFVSNDLSQIEMRVLAHESGDAKLIHIFKNNLDIHSMTASGIFKLDIELLDEMKHRYPSKRVGFGVVYGITAAGLQEQLLMMGLDPDYWTTAQCQELIDDWFKLYPGVDLYMQDLVAFALRHGYVKDMFGRRRYLGTIRSSSKRARAEAARQAGNMPIQSGAAGVFKAGMKNLTPIYKDFQAQGYYCDPVLPTHDDLLFEVSEDIVDVWVPLQQDVMENSVTLKVPVKSDAKVGKIWGEMKKYKW